MRFKQFEYSIEAEVEFSAEEVQALVDLSKRHYDDICIMAGLQMGEVHSKIGKAVESGFLVRLLLFRESRFGLISAIWPFRNFDTTLKILEQRGLLRRDSPSQYRQFLLCESLWWKMQEVCNQINTEYQLLRAASGRETVNEEAAN